MPENSSNPQLDIRIGTLVSMANGPSHITQLLPHGFESFSLTFWQEINVDFAENAAKSLESCGDQAVISSIGFFGNPCAPLKGAKLLIQIKGSAACRKRISGSREGAHVAPFLGRA